MSMRKTEEALPRFFQQPPKDVGTAKQQHESRNDAGVTADATAVARRTGGGVALPRPCDTGVAAAVSTAT
jgi:hypothetical protein